MPQPDSLLLRSGVSNAFSKSKINVSTCPPLLTLIFISVAFSPRPLGIGMHFQTLISSAEGADDGVAKFTSLVSRD